MRGSARGCERGPSLEETREALSDLVQSGKVRCPGACSMHAWEFAKALYLQRQHGWARFVSMQHHCIGV